MADVPGRILVESTACVDPHGKSPQGRGVRMYLTETGLAFDTDPQPLAIAYPEMRAVTYEHGRGHIQHGGRMTSFRCVAPWWGSLPAETRLMVDLILRVKREGPLAVGEPQLKRLYRLRTGYVFPLVLWILGGVAGSASGLVSGVVGALSMGGAGYLMGQVKHSTWPAGVKLAAYLLCVLGGVALYLAAVIALANLFPDVFRRT